MFLSLTPQSKDPLLALIDSFSRDDRSNKIDLGVGTYRDETGHTPVMKVVKQAEQILVRDQRSKTYLGSQGDERFTELLLPIIVGPGMVRKGRLFGVQTPGGCGALRLGAELIARASPSPRVWLGVPSWPNYAAIFKASGFAISTYDYYDAQDQAVCFDQLLATLSAACAGDVVVLQGSCHNPTGCDFTGQQWDEIADLLAEKQLLPFIDLAYQGLGDGMEPDRQGLERIMSRLDTVLVAYSCDKNFGLYRERTGVLAVLAADASLADIMYGNLLSLVRANWSMPPDHGAAIVRTILESRELERLWRIELEEMRQRVMNVRQAIAAADPRLGFLAEQRGMFSQLPVDSGFAVRLRNRHAIYIADSGRINLAGLRMQDVRLFVSAMEDVTLRNREQEFAGQAPIRRQGRP